MLGGLGGGVSSDSGDAHRCEWQTSPPPPSPVVFKKKKKIASSLCPAVQRPCSSWAKGVALPNSLISPILRGAAAGSCWPCLESRGQGHGRLGSPRRPAPLPCSHRRVPRCCNPGGGEGEGGGDTTRHRLPQPLPPAPPVSFGLVLFLCRAPSPSPTAGEGESLRTGQVAHAKAGGVGEWKI